VNPIPRAGHLLPHGALSWAATRDPDFFSFCARKADKTPKRLDEEELADWRAGRNAIYQLAALTIGARLAVADAQPSIFYRTRSVADDRLIRQPFPQKDVVPTMISVAQFSYRLPNNRTRRGRIFGLGLADVHRFQQPRRLGRNGRFTGTENVNLTKPAKRLVRGSATRTLITLSKSCSRFAFTAGGERGKRC